MDSQQLQQILLLVCALVCVLPLVFTLGVIAFVWWWGRKFVDQLVEVDTAKLQKRYEQLVLTRPAEDAMRTLIHEQALRSGMIGAITGIGGLITLPVALPIDFLLSSRIQASLVETIAESHQGSARQRSQVLAAAIAMGSERVSAGTSAMTIQFVRYFLSKSFARVIPVIGAATGFLVNYWITRGVGYAALRWYKS